MKKIFTCFLALCPMVASADYLDDKIASLTKEKLEKIAKLEECQKNTKGLKIAGITTLGVSAIGIGANIGEAVALNKLDEKISTAEQNKSNLDKQIDGVKNAQNTCGTKTCSTPAPTQSDLDSLNATEAVCKDGNWVAKTCKPEYSGNEQTCTLNGATVKYIDSCKFVNSAVKQCPEVTDEWKAQHNAKSGACDTTINEIYIKECEDKFDGVPRTTGNKQGYEKCEKQEQTQPISPERKHHEDCSAAETAQIPNAEASWWYIDKCVAKSCKPGWYLAVKGTSSQGYCMKPCPEWQITDGPNGGKACDITNAAQEEIASCGASCSTQCESECKVEMGATETVCVNGAHKPTNCSAGSPIGEAKQCKNGNTVVTYYEACPKSSENVVTECQEKKQGWTYYKMVDCNAFASVCGYQYTTSCSISMGVCDESLCVQYLKNKMRNMGDTGIELKADPSNAKNKSSGTVPEKKELLACKSFSLPNIGNQMACYNMCTKDASVKNCKINKAIISNNECVCNPGTGRNMGGRLITYNYSYDTANYEATATFEIDGQQYSEVGHFMAVGPSKHEQRLNDKVTKKLESLGYSNFKISCKGCP